jgi:hypothetical protein
MAKQIGFLKIIGTLGDITFYQMDGKFYARKKSSLDGKRVKKDPKFRRTMEEAGRFGSASKAAKEIYWLLPEEQRGHGVFGKLTGRIRRLMKAGMSPDEAMLELLKELCIMPEKESQTYDQKKLQPVDFAEQVLRAVFAPAVNAQTCSQPVERKPTYNVPEGYTQLDLPELIKDISSSESQGMRAVKIFIPLHIEEFIDKKPLTTHLIWQRDR